MTSYSTAPKVERSIELDAGPDEVWPFVAEPDRLEGWLGDRVEIDMQPGGCGHVIDDEGVRREVLVTAVEPGRRLAWHWWGEDGELSSVEITLVPQHAGTRVDVVEVATVSASSGSASLRPRACAAGSISGLARRFGAVRVPA